MLGLSALVHFQFSFACVHPLLSGSSDQDTCWVSETTLLFLSHRLHAADVVESERDRTFRRQKKCTSVSEDVGV